MRPDRPSDSNVTFHTPLGGVQVVVDASDPEYPGVTVRLVRKDGTSDLLSCVEYDSASNSMVTTAYDADRDEPVVIHHHKL